MTMEITHLNPDGSVTREWMLGHEDPQNAKVVVITKRTLNLLPGRYAHHATKPCYMWQADDGPIREYGASVGALRLMLKRAFPNATIVDQTRRSARD